MYSNELNWGGYSSFNLYKCPLIDMFFVRMPLSFLLDYLDLYRNDKVEHYYMFSLFYIKVMTSLFNNQFL